MNNAISKDDTTPIVVVIPGLSSDSASAVSQELQSLFNLAPDMMMSVCFWKVLVSCQMPT